MSSMPQILRAYERWAWNYPPVAHNPLMRAEQQLMLELAPEVVGSRVLDLACGSGRYSRLLREANAAQVVALDFCAPMLRQVSVPQRVCASMMRLPFREAVFDCIISGLAVGHATDLRAWMVEAARVLCSGGTLLYSDFHPEAARAGMTRSFKDEQNATWTVPHETHELVRHQETVVAAGLKLESIREVRVGLELQEAFSGSEQIYRDWHGLPLVLVVRARK
jgi:ubiquinone/menaquinone biosynthesis C-methylase UbiE